MYDEIGKKIKTLAKVSFIIMAIIIGIVGIVLAIYLKDEPKLVLLAILGACLAIFFAWISTFMVYGFGELIDRACSIDDKLSENDMDVDNLQKRKIQKLDKLMENGLITEEDYQKAISKESEGK